MGEDVIHAMAFDYGNGMMSMMVAGAEGASKHSGCDFVVESSRIVGAQASC